MMTAQGPAPTIQDILDSLGLSRLLGQNCDGATDEPKYSPPLNKKLYI
jgi:hypothetical protein